MSVFSWTLDAMHAGYTFAEPPCGATNESQNTINIKMQAAEDLILISSTIVH